MHKLLERQVRNASNNPSNGQVDFNLLLEMVSTSYEEADKERLMTDRSMSLMSQELSELNQKIREQSEAKVQAVMDNVAEGIITFDEAGTIETFNPAAEHIFGFSAEEVIDRNIGFIMPGSGEEGTDNTIFEKLNTDSSTILGVCCEFTGWRKSGSKFPMELTISQMDLSEKRLFIAIVRDITERKLVEKEKSKLESQLRRSQKMEAIGTLAGGIAHDFNNLLWIIMGNTEMSLRKLPKDSPVRSKQQEILTASKRAKDLVEQILTFSRQDEQENKPVQVHLILKEILSLIRSTLPATIKLIQNVDKNCGTVMADPTQIHQLVMNLCTNAYQAMGEERGLLEVTLSTFKMDSKTIKAYPGLQEGNYIELVVRDTGCGMDKETVERIFDPFFTTKEVGKGTGLGLATVHGIVVGMGGTIKVNSEPGKGSTFRIFLPQHEGSTIEVTSEGMESSSRNGNEHILVVDDEKQAVSMIQEMLEELGYDITTQTSSVEALRQFHSQPDKFDLVITDQTMPDMTGLELAEQVINIRPDIPVILATGFSQRITEERIKGSGIREYLKKPMGSQDLEKVVRRLLDDRNESN